MSFALADAARLTQNLLQRGVIETMITESALLRYMQFMTVVGSGISYNRELVPATADWHPVNGTWTADELTVEQKTATLKILGGDADVDAFLQQTYANRNDIQAIVVQNKAKALAYAFNNAFFNGDSSADANQFDGLAVEAGTPAAASSLDKTQRAFYAGANGAVITLDMMDILVDAIKPGKPDVLFLSKRTRRKLSSLRRASGSVLEVGVDQFGRRVSMWDGIPVETDDNIPDNETQGTGVGICSSVYAVRFGAAQHVSGLQNGGIQAVPVGALETKDAMRTRLKWYCGIAIFNTWSFARLAGVKDS